MVRSTRNHTYEFPAGNDADAATSAGAGGNRTQHESHWEQPLPHAPPPPLTAEMFMQQMLGSQHNTEQAHKNMEDIMCNFANRENQR
jgi:hypothetical protein